MTPTGPAHLGLLHAGPDDLAAGALPTLRAALAAGVAVHTVVDRRTVRALRDVLGGDPPVTFRPPSELRREDPQHLVGALRRTAEEAGPAGALVLVAHGPADDAAAVAAFEQAVAVMLADVPLTLLCTAYREGDPAVAAAVVAGHPHLLAGGSPTTNPRHRPAADRCVTPASLWGSRTVRLAVRGTGDLRTVRERVSEVAGGIGLDTDETAEAVLAVHEAALLATGDPTTGPDGPGGSGGAGLPEGPPDLPSACLVEVRTDGRTMLAEVSGPPTPDPDREPTLRVVRRMGGAAAVHDAGGSRPVRVVAGRGTVLPAPPAP